MTKQRGAVDAAAQDVGTESGPTAASVEMIDIRWTPTPTNMTSERNIDEFTWTPGSVVSVPLAWWKKYEVALRTSPRETFEVAAA
jgi:hypothetical protein